MPRDELQGEQLRPSQRGVFAYALLGGVLWWLSFPPLGLWPLAFCAAAVWALLIRRREMPVIAGAGTGGGTETSSRLRRAWRWLRASVSGPYGAIYGAALLSWLVMLYWVLIPGWLWALGWLALSVWLACGLPVFVAVCRLMVHRWRLSPILAAPLVWVAMEWVQAHGIAAFSMCILGLSQYKLPLLIQVADLGGVYAVSFAVMFLGACLGRMLPCQDRGWTLWPLAPLAAGLLMILAYGWYRLDSNGPDNGEGPRLRIALLQCSYGREMDDIVRHKEIVHGAYLRRARMALSQYGKLDLIAWPETTFHARLISYDDERPFKPDAVSLNDEQWMQRLAQNRAYWEAKIKSTAGELNTPLLVGLFARHYGPAAMDRYNTAALFDRKGRLVSRYDKTHRIIFAEYVPLSERFPWLNSFFALKTPLAKGSGPVAMPAGELRLAPAICYEITLPHRVRPQVLQSGPDGRRPDALIMLGSNAWFWGSSEQELILMSAVLRAVEHNKPMLVAANTGISAWIGPDGRIVEQAPASAEGVIVADIGPNQRQSIYTRLGDWLPIGCLMLCAAAIVVRIGQAVKAVS